MKHIEFVRLLKGNNSLEYTNMPWPCQQISDEPELVGLVIFTSWYVEMPSSEKYTFIMFDEICSEAARFEI